MTERRLQQAICALAVLGAGIAAYLTVAHLAHAPVVCVSGGCETVQHSAYSELFGIPVAAIGLAGYVLIGASSRPRTDLARTAGAAAALAGLVFAAYLVYVQVSIIGAVCQWCIASDVVLAILVVATFLRLRADPR
ncbi:MAG TPA: vitamin K epoxide reductase family protein [Gaiellaceae bacterium]|nr:vitamin K epoxide reductase family protein [Gaiellaceae bacterium]